MKNYFIAATAIIGLAGCASIAQNGNNETPPKDNKDVSYALGVSIGENLMSDGLIDLDYAELAKGLEESNNGTATVTTEAAQKLIHDFQTEQKSALYAANLEKAETFLAENKGKDGVQTTASGLQYKVLTEGSGATPSAMDKVTVHYAGTLLDGTPFDSSIERGTPATFGVTQVIKGWIEGLQLMNVGAKYEFYIHPDLGYGLNPRKGGVIKPNDALIFTVELIKIN